MKTFWVKKIWVKNIFGKENIWVQNILGKKNLGQKIIESKKIWVKEFSEFLWWVGGGGV